MRSLRANPEPAYTNVRPNLQANHEDHEAHEAMNLTYRRDYI
jgi:hypothetical protein